MTEHTIRTVTLLEGDDAPAMICDTHYAGWNGWHVPIVTATETIHYWTMLKAYDPRGPWDAPYVDDNNNLCIPVPDGADDVYYPTETTVDGVARYALDGMVWDSSDNAAPMTTETYGI